jgi:hypothetical protein
MGGGLMQLVAYGAQDIYLTGNPQITFFKVVYRRHTNFSMESIQQTWAGTITAAASRATATISRNGDLVHRLYLETDATFRSDSHQNPGSWLIKNVEVEIGGQSIDKHYGHWMEVWAELTEPNSAGLMKTSAANSAGTMFQNMSGMGGVADGSGACGKLFIPLQFWFCRNPGLALPLIALQYHEVKIILETNTLAGSPVTANPQLWADYIYLDTDERRRFAQVSHEYLIEQVQHQNGTIGTSGLTLNFNHPVKELIWTNQYSDGATAAISAGDFLLKLNGHDRFAVRNYKYFTRSQVWQYHTGVCGINTGGTPGAGVIADNIAVYSFALKPEEHQPSGTCNFSRIDSAQLSSTSTAITSAEVYAVNYNVLRIMSGMGGLAYSN